MNCPPEVGQTSKGSADSRTKYKTEFKLKVVQSFLAGEGGAKLLAQVLKDFVDKHRKSESHPQNYTSRTASNRSTYLGECLKYFRPITLSYMRELF
jgi:uncharacterized protein with ParB-like and HNH nuclease domain